MYTEKARTATRLASCDFCQNAIPLLDLEEGRASVISGKACCQSCMEEGAWVGSASAPPRPGMMQRRAHPRFHPSIQCGLVLRLPGLRGFLLGNLSREWLDVSEGGLRAVVRRGCSVGLRLVAQISHRPRRRTYRVAVTVRHAQESGQIPGSFVIGVQFESPRAELKELIRKLHLPAGFLGAREQMTREEAKRKS